MKPLADYTLEEKIGQMFMCGFDGTEPTEGIRELIRQQRIGGIIYFRRNIATPAQVAELSRALQEERSEGSPPLFIAIDQEGGMVSRIDRDIALIPGAMALGAAGNAEDAYLSAAISGRELRLMGINVNFAPSVDVNNNPLNPVIGIRSYGEDPHAVAEMGVAAVKGYAAAGVAATIKHFPGHGDTEFDSHLGLPLIPHNEERLFEVELYPFIEAIAAGADAVMTAHVVFPAFGDADLPATLNASVVTDLLRGRLGYTGVIVTDCLEMQAISGVYGIPEGAVMAVEAGADLVLVSHTLAEQQAAIAAVVAAVQQGRLSLERIDASVERILALKRRRQMEQKAVSADELAAALARPEDLAALREISERSITLVKDEGQLPLDRHEPTFVIWAEPHEWTQVVEVIEQQETLGTALAAWMDEVHEQRIGLSPTEAEITELLDTAAGYRQVVVATHNPLSRLDAGQARLVRGLAARTDTRVVAVSTRNPYDINEYPQVKTYLCAYENRPVPMAALARILVGLLPARGKLPVSLSAEYPRGQ